MNDASPRLRWLFWALVVLGLGESGLATRVLAHRFGSMWTYAGRLRDIGQPDVSTLLNDYRFRTIGDATDVYGLVAGSVTHSVSTAMHNAAFRAAHRDAVYLPFRAASADDFMTFGRALGIKGASVTIPTSSTLRKSGSFTSEVTTTFIGSSLNHRMPPNTTST